MIRFEGEMQRQDEAAFLVADRIQRIGGPATRCSRILLSQVRETAGARAQQQGGTAGADWKQKIQMFPRPQLPQLEEDGTILTSGLASPRQYQRTQLGLLEVELPVPEMNQDSGKPTAQIRLGGPLGLGSGDS